MKGSTPAVLLMNPKHAHNVGNALRACSCFGGRQLLWTGNRVTLDVEKGERLPREERMKQYQNVEMIRSERPFDLFPRGVVPVAIEVRENAEPLHSFEHPEDALYVFGPEDGSIPSWALRHCHRFIVIPSNHCLNLASAVNLVLGHRRMQRILKGVESPIYPGVAEDRGFIQDGSEVFSGISEEGLGAAYASHRRTK